MYCTLFMIQTEKYTFLYIFILCIFSFISVVSAVTVAACFLVALFLKEKLEKNILKGFTEGKKKLFEENLKFPEKLKNIVPA